MFGSRGYAHTRIADICADAGVAKGLFYWYFPNKESLFMELVDSMRLRLRRAQATAMHDAADPITRIRQGTEASIRFILENQSYFAFLDLQRADPTISSVIEQGSDVYERDIERLIVQAQSEGMMPDVDAHFAAVGVVGAVSSFGYAGGPAGAPGGRLGHAGPDRPSCSASAWSRRIIALTNASTKRGSNSAPLQPRIRLMASTLEMASL